MIDTIVDRQASIKNKNKKVKDKKYIVRINIRRFDR